MSWLILNEATIRLGCFLGIFSIMLCWESLSPKRSPIAIMDPGLSNLKRRLNNLGLSLINTLMLRGLPFLSAVLAAKWASDQQFGLLHYTSFPFIVSCILSILFLDMMIYFQHRLFHIIPVLWRLHRVHHSDEHIDSTTAIRFHPVEILLSMLIKIGLVTLLGAPMEAVILFEIILNGGALFNHSNVNLPLRLDQGIRTLIVTPDMHRIHHSIHSDEMNKNFGFSFSFWDRIFGSYLHSPKDGQDNMKIGLPKLRGARTRSIMKLLTQPGLSNKANQ